MKTARVQEINGELYVVVSDPDLSYLRLYYFTTFFSELLQPDGRFYIYNGQDVTDRIFGSQEG